MAREVILRDDVDGSYDDVQTCLLTWGETSVEVDLSATNRQLIGDVLAPYLSAGRKHRRPTNSPRSTPRSRPSKAEVQERAAIRAWAAAAGLAVPARGPIPEDVTRQYHQSTADQGSWHSQDPEPDA